MSLTSSVPYVYFKVKELDESAVHKLGAAEKPTIQQVTHLICTVEIDGIAATNNATARFTIH
jgi:hypothetical protein